MSAIPLTRPRISITFDFVRSTKNYHLYEQRGGINKLYLPHDGSDRVHAEITVEVK